MACIAIVVLLYGILFHVVKQLSDDETWLRVPKNSAQRIDSIDYLPKKYFSPSRGVKKKNKGGR